jgi:hypothetical protein
MTDTTTQPSSNDSHDSWLMTHEAWAWVMSPEPCYVFGMLNCSASQPTEIIPDRLLHIPQSSQTGLDCGMWSKFVHKNKFTMPLFGCSIVIIGVNRCPCQLRRENKANLRQMDKKWFIERRSALSNCCTRFVITHHYHHHGHYAFGSNRCNLDFRSEMVRCLGGTLLTFSFRVRHQNLNL